MAYSWFLARMTRKRAQGVWFWSSFGINIIEFWRTILCIDDADDRAPDDPAACVAAANDYLEAHHA